MKRFSTLLATIGLYSSIVHAQEEAEADMMMEMEMPEDEVAEPEEPYQEFQWNGTILEGYLIGGDKEEKEMEEGMEEDMEGKDEPKEMTMPEIMMKYSIDSELQ